MRTEIIAASTKIFCGRASRCPNIGNLILFRFCFDYQLLTASSNVDSDLMRIKSTDYIKVHSFGDLLLAASAFNILYLLIREKLLKICKHQRETSNDIFTVNYKDVLEENKTINLFFALIHVMCDS